MKSLIPVGVLLLTLCVRHGLIAQTAYCLNLQKSLAELSKGTGKHILVTAHRGDWRQTPENSLQALQNCIRQGYDIVELDLAKTKDGHLIIMHDKTIDRTTTGKGKPSDYILADIQKFYLRSGTGHSTIHHIPGFEEELDAAKGKIIIDVDKGYPYIEEALTLIRQRGMINQIIYNVADQTPLDTVLKEHPSIPDELTLMVVVNMQKPDAVAVMQSYQKRKNAIVQPIFSSDTTAGLQQLSQIKKTNRVWMNGLWPEQNGGHDDDRAVEKGERDEAWGWLVTHGAGIIQTDRPQELLVYLRKKGLHP